MKQNVLHQEETCKINSHIHEEKQNTGDFPCEMTDFWHIFWIPKLLRLNKATRNAENYACSCNNETYWGLQYIYLPSEYIKNDETYWGKYSIYMYHLNT